MLVESSRWALPTHGQDEKEIKITQLTLWLIQQEVNRLLALGII